MAFGLCPQRQLQRSWQNINHKKETRNERNNSIGFADFADFAKNKMPAMWEERICATGCEAQKVLLECL